MADRETETLAEAMGSLVELPGVLGAVVSSLPGGLVMAQAGNVAWWLQAFTDARMLEVAGADVEEGRFTIGEVEVLAISPTPLLLCVVAFDTSVEPVRMRRQLNRVARLAAG